MNEEKYMYLLGRVTFHEALMTGFLIGLSKPQTNPEAFLATFEKNVMDSLNLSMVVAEGTSIKQAEDIREAALDSANTLFSIVRKAIKR